MKKTISLIIAIALIILNSCWLYSCKKNDADYLSFQINKGGESCSVIGLHNCMSTSIVIPHEYKGVPVTKIGEKAFFEFEALESVTIPSSVTLIDDQAFQGCSNLREVYFDGTVSQWERVRLTFHCFQYTLVDKIICSDGVAD